MMMKTSDAYKEWMNSVTSGAEPVDQTGILRFASDEPINVVKFVKQERPGYTAEVAKKGSDYIYHFYPSEEVAKEFEEVMGDAFLTVFKLEDRVEASFVPEFGSWDVRARGFASNPLADSLALRVFDVLDQLLE